MTSPAPAVTPVRPSPTGVWPRLVHAASRVRGERVIHAEGVALSGTVDLPGGAGTGVPLLDEPGRYDALLRFSRAVGLPDALPDFLGLAVRVLDAGGPGRHQDLVLDTGSGLPLLRCLPLPRRDLAGVTYSSLASVDVGGRRLRVAARALGPHPVTTVDALPAALPLRLDLLVGARTGPWTRVGTVSADAVLPAPEGRRLRFSPFVTGGGLVPVGRLNEWRRGAYEASHVGPDA